MRDSEHDANLYMSGDVHAGRGRNIVESVAGGSPSGDAAADGLRGQLPGRCESGPLTQSTSGSVESRHAGTDRPIRRADFKSATATVNNDADCRRSQIRAEQGAMGLGAGVAPGPLTPDWNAPNGHLIPEYMRGAGAVIDWARTERWQMTQRAERRREYGAKAVGMLTALLNMGELPECYREQAREIIREWER